MALCRPTALKCSFSALAPAAAIACFAKWSLSLPGKHGSETSAEGIHGKKVESHGGAAKVGRDEVLDGGIDRGVIDVAHRATCGHDEHKENRLTGSLVQREVRA